ncbi:MAG: ABC transporter substrate-binding protein [Thermobacillus sp. ZCTH02-B1]|uniref:ABC transporter substrate-binding protein n=1 Tax=Thermobacillus sp. ZCTH02-B1 TaxID=1858795 RepID=UPI000B574043|nr:ABC transporter substrate-binding protein [Thermobacillus sp. ZCTH02-B1]OUM95298.1 MAG: ABC transporter substrate-binding protein [Thermobacillus sp. ZCTH02-B1]
MKAFKSFAFLSLCTILLVGLLSACSGGNKENTGSSNSGSAGGSTGTSSESTGSAAGSGKEIKITFFNTSAEVNTVFEELFAKYHEINPNVTVELIPTPIGGAQIEIFQSRLASGNPPTISNLDAGHILLYKDKFLDLESVRAKYEELTLPGAVEGGVLDGKFLGIPWSAQGYGLLYNTRVVEEAIGGPFDPSTIRTRDDLAALLEKVDAAGIPPVIIHGADWSLGAHYFALGFSLQSRNAEERFQFWEDLKAGKVKLADNAVFNGLMDTFDLLKKYNARKNDPLVANYELDSADFARGKAAFYFMGDWTWAVIGSLEDRDNDFGVLPIPISNNPDDYGNGQIPYSEPKLFAIDNSAATPEEQQAALEFIEWMLTSEEGQKAIVEKMGLVMPYKDVKAESSNVIAKAVAEYVSRGETIDISIINYFPADYWANNGASMQKYLVDKIDRAGLFEEIEKYWQNVD